ncbi:hypothetical protein ADK77_02655 [Streptomyces antibioticus]|nr:hypothetical protein ADK77_02655 [Streptomyces antibioticus]
MGGGELFGVLLDGLALLGVGDVAGAAASALGLLLALDLLGREARRLVQGEVGSVEESTLMSLTT